MNRGTIDPRSRSHDRIRAAVRTPGVRTPGVRTPGVRTLIVATLLPLLVACSGESAVDGTRLLPIDDMSDRPYGLEFGNRHELRITDGGLLITDPIYLADVYNPNDDPVAAYVRAEGVFVCDFGGDVSCPVWWKKPHLILPTWMEMGDANDPDDAEDDDVDDARPLPRGASVVVPEIYCDSGSFVFLALTPDVPDDVRTKIDLVISEGNAWVAEIPSGRYTFWYEQGGDSDTQYPGWFRNIVAVLE